MDSHFWQAAGNSDKQAGLGWAQTKYLKCDGPDGPDGPQSWAWAPRVRVGLRGHQTTTRKPSTFLICPCGSNEGKTIQSGAISVRFGCWTLLQAGLSRQSNSSSPIRMQQDLIGEQAGPTSFPSAAHAAGSGPCGSYSSSCDSSLASKAGSSSSSTGSTLQQVVGSKDGWEGETHPRTGGDH